MGRRLMEQADGKSTGHKSGYHKFIKKYKVRAERRQAKRDPECQAAYRKYAGYET